MGYDLKIVLQASDSLELMGMLHHLEAYGLVQKKSFAPEVKSKR